MAPGLGLAHTDPTSYHESKKLANGASHQHTKIPAVPVLQNNCTVEDVVEALKVVPYEYAS